MTDMYVLINYANRVGVHLKNFKQKKARLWEFSHSCEVQHGSKNLKRRGYIYESKTGTALNVTCKHCGYSRSLGNFIREISPSLFDEFRLETYTSTFEKPTAQQTAEKEIEPVTNLYGLIPVTKLPPSSSVLKFIERRKIPESAYKLMYVAKNFYDWGSQFKPDFKKLKDDSPRLVFPYFNKNGDVLGFTARTFSPTVVPRYIHLRTNKSEEFIYGKERVTETGTIYITEGQIDSLFLPNGVAVGGAHYDGDFINHHKDRIVIIPDTDWKRNKQVGDQVKRAINRGFKISFIPNTVKGKDLNDIVKNGMSITDLKKLVDDNTLQGLRASLEFSLLKKY
jgi:hypothetical protein